MTDPDDVRGLHASGEEGMERLYESLGVLVERTLRRRFAVPQQDAEKLAREIVCEYVMRGTMVDDPREGLMAMAGESGRTWQRRNAIAPAPVAPAALSETVREMVRLRVEEQRTYQEIAAEMGVTAYYAEAAVKRALETLRRNALPGRK
jgi:hypothetical protein